MGILNRNKKTTDEKEEVVAVKEVATTVPSTKNSVKPKASLSTGVDTSFVIVKPLISEKAAILAGENQYVFVVRKSANRLEVRSAIQKMYGVSPTSINISNVRGKIVKRGRTTGKRSNWKKAIVTLPKGQTINVYEGV